MLPKVSVVKLAKVFTRHSTLVIKKLCALREEKLEVVAKLMGHTNADVTLNVYTQVMDDSLRTAVDRVGNEVFTIVHSGEGAKELSH